MAISIDWGTKIVTIPKSFMTLVGANLYDLDLNAFRLALKDLEDDEVGMPAAATHNHNAPVTVGGTTLARVVEIINGYTVTFEDGQYAVQAKGANSNIADVMNVNQVSLRTFNTAGLITVVSGSGVTEQDKLDIADRVWDEMIAQHTTEGSTAEALSEAAEGGGATPEEIADAVWDEQRDEHTDPGSFGTTEEWVGDIDIDAIAAAAAVAVWDEDRVDHTDPGTFGDTSEWAGQVDVDSIADAVWDESADEHIADGTMGELENKLGNIDLAKPKIVPGD